MAGEEREGEYVVLTDESGESHEFEVLDVINVEGKEYAILSEPRDEDDAFALRIDEDDKGNDVLVDIEDDAEWEAVAQAWEETQDEEWDEDEDDDAEEDAEDDAEDDDAESHDVEGQDEGSENDENDDED